MKRSAFRIAIWAGLLAGSGLLAEPPPDHSPALVEVADAPNQPRVLLIGDSISEGYTLPVRERLRGRMNVHHPAENCRATDLGLVHLDRWLGSGHWDVIHFNFGLHDLIHHVTTGPGDPIAAGTVRVSLPQYESNLRDLVRRLRATGAKLIFATTTPVPAGTIGRVEGEERAYNEVARRVMRENEIPIDDLWSFVRPRQALIQHPADVHYTPEGYEQIADAVAASIIQALRDPSLVEVPDVPGLPRVMLIGDSISEGYTLLVRARLKGRANVHRCLQNGGATERGLERLDAWLGTGHWDVIHFNFGLHDLKYLDATGHYVEPREGKLYTPLPVYEKNLRELARRLQRTGARLIFATTTPVPAGTLGRIEGDERYYNAVAVRVMQESNIPIEDLWALVRPRQATIQIPGDVHFTPAGYEQIAEVVTANIIKALP